MIPLEQLKKQVKEKQKIFAQVLKKANNQKIIKRLPALHEKVFEKIDCLDCANCCKNYSPRFRLPDIKRIAKHLKMKETVFIETYLKVDEDEDFVLQNSPCPFLDADNKCSIYDVRPRDCQRYPYTDEDVLVKQAGLTLKNATVCPAVFSILERLGQEV